MKLEPDDEEAQGGSGDLKTRRQREMGKDIDSMFRTKV